MKDKQNHIDETVLLKVLNNTADKTEMDLFNRWVNAAEENTRHFEQLKKVHDLSFVDGNSFQRNWNAVVTKYESGKNVPDYIEGQASKSKKQTISIRTLIRIAAVLVILFGITILLKNIVFDPKQLLVTSEDLNRNEPYKLADGSLVYLNGKSEIEFSNDFGSKNRMLTLRGEAFFEVQPNKEIPFIISANKTSVKVVGTSFNVFSDSSEQVQISVVEGVVEFSTSKKENLVKLTAGEEGTYNSTSDRITKSNIENPNFLAWKTGVLNFDETPIKEAFQVLQKHYSRVFVFEDSGKMPQTLTTEFDNQPLEDVLEELNLLLNINYESRNDTIFFIEKH